MKEMKLESLNISPAKIKQFEQKNITNVEELIYFLPKKAIKIQKVNAVDPSLANQTIGLVATLTKIKVGKADILTFKAENSIFNVVIFNKSHITRNMLVNHSYYIVGDLTLSIYNKLQIIMPTILELHNEEGNCKDIITSYSTIKGMSLDFLKKQLKKGVAVIPTKEFLPLEFIEKYQLISKKAAYEQIHFPNSMAEYEEGIRRHTFEILYLQAKGLSEMDKTSNDSPFKPIFDNTVNKVLSDLPFDLTEGQKEVLKEFEEKTKKGEKINALLQGDVGTGKTIVSILLMASLVDAGYQAAMLAPTGVLAWQHYLEIKERLEPYGLNVAFLNNKVAEKKREKKKIIDGLKAGEIDILVGTHAILQPDVEFKKLALVVVDEEQRFGVSDREALTKEKSIHLVRMSATPIPRSLALTLYSSSVSMHVIKTLPKGRKPVKTAFLNDDVRIANGIRQQIKNKNQVYIICPLVEESTSEVMENVLSVEETYNKYVQLFKDDDSIKIGVLNGQMKTEDIEIVLSKFEKNEINVLISTTVVEVGINVPNSTMMIIQNAERFGLSQLHQLRGRVGRSDIQSYCIMSSPKGCSERLYAMTQTNDGFEIAEIDLKMRGAGDLLGVKQSGKTEQIYVIQNNLELFAEIKKYIHKNKHFSN